MATVSQLEDREERVYLITLVLFLLFAWEVVDRQGLSLWTAGAAALILALVWPTISIFLVRVWGVSRWRNAAHLGDQVDTSRFGKVVPRVRCASRTCTDGLCCFVGVGNMVPRGARDDVILLVARYGKGDDPTRLLSRSSPRSLVVRRACADLSVGAKVDGDRLELDLSCRGYEERPDACSEYPGKDRRCILADHADGEAVALLGFSKAEFPEIAPFSISRDALLGQEYHLVPVPTKGLGKVLIDRG